MTSTISFLTFTTLELPLWTFCTGMISTITFLTFATLERPVKKILFNFKKKLARTLIYGVDTEYVLEKPFNRK